MDLYKNKMFSLFCFSKLNWRTWLLKNCFQVKLQIFFILETLSSTLFLFIIINERLMNQWEEKNIYHI